MNEMFTDLSPPLFRTTAQVEAGTMQFKNKGATPFFFFVSGRTALLVKNFPLTVLQHAWVYVKQHFKISQLIQKF